MLIVTPADLMSATTYDHMFHGQGKFHTVGRGSVLLSRPARPGGGTRIAITYICAALICRLAPTGPGRMARGAATMQRHEHPRAAVRERRHDDPPGQVRRESRDACIQ